MARNLFPPGRPDPLDLERFGPRLEIAVGPPIARGQDRQPLPLSSDVGGQKFWRVPAMIDTGASRTVLTPLAIRKVGLLVVDYIRVIRAGGADERVAVYAASIQFPRYKLTPIDVIQVLCFELPEQPIQCLIGRDIFSRWLFTYDGQTGQWSIDEEAETSRVRSPWVEPPQAANDLVFVCHASEDKSFVDRLVAALKAAAINVWYDTDRMKWGDNLRTSIEEGLLNSRFGIVVFSKAFLKKKPWTEHELNGLFAKERDGKKVILPIWHEVTPEDLAEYSVTFVDRLALDSQKNSIQEIVSNLKSQLRRAT